VDKKPWAAIAFTFNGPTSPQNAEFIAFAANNLKALLDAAEKWEKAEPVLKEFVEKLGSIQVIIYNLDQPEANDEI